MTTSKTENTALMTAFKKAFAKGDADGLAGVLTDDFEWHMHWFGQGDPAPTGNVVRGVDAVLGEIEWRQANWSKVRFEGVTEQYVDDLVVQTFTISGIDHRGDTFEVDAVDLYRVVDGRLALKDTYWKQPAKAGEERA